MAVTVAVRLHSGETAHSSTRPATAGAAEEQRAEEEPLGVDVMVRRSGVQIEFGSSELAVSQFSHPPVYAPISGGQAACADRRLAVMTE